MLTACCHLVQVHLRDHAAVTHIINCEDKSLKGAESGLLLDLQTPETV